MRAQRLFTFGLALALVTPLAAQTPAPAQPAAGTAPKPAPTKKMAPRPMSQMAPTGKRLRGYTALGSKAGGVTT